MNIERETAVILAHRERVTEILAETGGEQDMTIKKGDKVRHIEHGDAVVLKVVKNCVVWIEITSGEMRGTKGTVSIHALRKI